ncbi:cyclase family protein [Robertkochia solimangrovi]|uniref:cyclase family protein n=1 Tax=Robertkochia solimangrovi TaxID=2213046 RepID=UPI00117D86B8|nr:cyclase family protein [Robertkochia solimangrovi]TRZ45899.1 cyclase family protein [Robertkochia solimangrovi]
MIEIIDLSQEIYEGMPVFKDLPQVRMRIHNSHEEWNGITNPVKRTPAVHELKLGEHTGTHVDAINHMAIEHEGKSIDKMPLSMFYTHGICLDFSHKDLNELISSEEIESACLKEGLEILKGDTVLLYTGHYFKHFNTPDWKNGPGITAEAARWFAHKRISAFGVETMSPGVSGVSNRDVHHICGEFGFTHYENLVNLDKLIGRGRFRFVGLPLKIRGGTGSPVRAVAIFE